MLLYKYCGPDGAAILRDRAIWLTDPQAFPDPFERVTGSLVLSMAARRDSVPMWRDYAAAHTGLAIGFDPMQGILAADAVPRYTIAPVAYGSSQAGWSDDRALLAKSDDWEAEDEWRIIAPGGDEASGPSPLRRSAPIRTDSVQEVLIGCRAGDRFEQEVAALLEQPHYRHVRLFRMVADARQYALDARQCRG